MLALQRLQGQVASLKGSRDKLLKEVDRQSLEIARLATENTALEQVSGPVHNTLTFSPRLSVTTLGHTCKAISWSDAPV